MRTVKIISLFACIALMILFVISFIWHVSDKGTGINSVTLIGKFTVMCFVAFSVLIPGTIIALSINRLDLIFNDKKTRR